MKIGIACASGSAKGVFIHGVLVAFENFGFSADFYAASSSSTIPTAFAAIHKIELLGGTDYWKWVNTKYVEASNDASKGVKAGIEHLLPLLEQKLFTNEASRFAIAVSAVVTKEASELTQGDGARKLGQQLVLCIRKKDKSWADKNLEYRLFDNRATVEKDKLTQHNIADALYSTTRILHAWKEAAWINGEPFIDASYTCVCPAIELSEKAMDIVIAISPEAGPFYRDFFQSETIPSYFGKSKILFIQPTRNLSEIGVDYLKSTEEGLALAFEMGKKQGLEFIENLRKAGSV
jgi:hypothetical protein